MIPLIVLIVALGLVVWLYNSLVGLRNQVKSAW